MHQYFQVVSNNYVCALKLWNKMTDHNLRNMEFLVCTIMVKFKFTMFLLSKFGPMPNG